MEGYSVNIDTDENIIKFQREYPEKTCKHYHIYVSIERNDLLCKDCNARLNPIFWIKEHMKLLNEVSRRNTTILAEAQVIQEKIEKKGTYVCMHCLEANEVDFKRLPSKKAIERRMSLIHEEITGYKVQV